MRVFTRFMIVLGLSAAASAAPTDELTFDGPASVRAWTFTNGPEFPGAEGSLGWEATKGHDARGALTLTYDFSGGGNYVGASVNLPEGNDARGVRLWVRKPGSHKLVFRAVDSSGQAFQKDTVYTLDAWQSLEIDLRHWTHWFGGAGDGAVHWPMRAFWIMVANDGDRKQGALYVDDLRWLDRNALEGGDETSTYEVTDFKGQPSWHPQGGEGNTLDGGTWRYRFNPGRRPVLQTELALQGRPQAIRLELDGDGSGHSVELVLGSHFQRFYRSIGTLDRKGPMTLEAELGVMSGWSHEGGQDDGVVRWPLRVVQLRLARRDDGPDAGTLKLHRIEADIRFDRSEAVILRPDISPVGDRMTYSVELQSLRSDNMPGTLIFERYALDGRIDRQTADMTLPGGARKIAHEWTCDRADRTFVESAFIWTDAELTTPPAFIGHATRPETIRPEGFDPDSPMGMGIYLNRWRWDARRTQRMDQLASLAEHAGVKWAREEFNWGLIESKPGEFDWSFYDELVETSARHHISIVGLLCYWSGWAEQNTDRGIDQYCDFVRAIVGRYKGRIRHWEIWNEPNIFFWTGPPELYAKLLARAYETIKEVDPEAVVGGCSTSTIDMSFVNLTIDRGGKFDLLTIHPYRGVLNDLQYLDELRAVKAAVPRPIWITEIGFPSQLRTGWSERRQASLLERTYLLSVASGAVDKIFWYNFRNDGNNQFEPEQNFGLVRSDLRLKPAYRAMATIARTVQDLRVVERIDIGEGGYAFRFSDGRRDVIAVCAPRAGRLLTFDGPPQVEITNGVGESLEALRHGNRYTVTLDTGFPVYVSGPAGMTFSPLDAVITAKPAAANVRAGAKVTVTLQPGMDIRRWELPYGWQRPVRRSTGVYEIAVPADVPPQRVQLQMFVQRGGMLRVPVTIEVQPARIRF